MKRLSTLLREVELKELEADMEVRLSVFGLRNSLLKRRRIRLEKQKILEEIEKSKGKSAVLEKKQEKI